MTQIVWKDIPPICQFGVCLCVMYAEYWNIVIHHYPYHVVCGYIDDAPIREKKWWLHDSTHIHNPQYGIFVYLS